jgi:hypothetical protein
MAKGSCNAGAFCFLENGAAKKREPFYYVAYGCYDAEAGGFGIVGRRLEPTPNGGCIPPARKSMQHRSRAVACL